MKFDGDYVDEFSRILQETQFFFFAHLIPGIVDISPLYM